MNTHTKKNGTRTTWIIVLLVILLPIVALTGLSKLPGKYDSFAGCIADSGVKFYGTYWCPHCAEQKALFGKSVKKLPYLECSLPPKERTAATQAAQQAYANGTLKEGQDPRTIGIKMDTDVCYDAGITGYPTWKFTDGTTISRVMTLTELSEKTSCQIK